jgi:hypothetical protein
MGPGRRRLATGSVAMLVLFLLAPGAVAAKEPPKFPTQGTDALAKGSWIVTLKNGADVASAARMSRKVDGKVGLTYSHALNGFQLMGSAKAAPRSARTRESRQ